MGRRQAKKRYVAPELREAKEFADRCGQEYYEAIWRGPKLLAGRRLTEIFSQHTQHDCTKYLEEVDRKIAQAAKDLPVAKENLRRARAELAALKQSAFDSTTRLVRP